MSRRGEREIRALRERLGARDSAAAAASLLHELMLRDLPCPACLEAHAATIRAWRELGWPDSPGRSVTALGGLWAWSGSDCSSCRVNWYLRRRPAVALGGTWRGLRVEFTGGFAPRDAALQWNAWRKPVEAIRRDREPAQASPPVVVRASPDRDLVEGGHAGPVRPPLGFRGGFADLLDRPAPVRSLLPPPPRPRKCDLCGGPILGLVQIVPSTGTTRHADGCPAPA